ncbi:MAG: FecR domain-containing protein [Firmicutes bacterium]|nr:FecR domain-containing protein [Bacillota bacterium]
MKKIILIISCILILGGIISVKAGEDSVVITQLSGRVEKKIVRKLLFFKINGWRQLEKGEQLETGEQIRVGKNAELELYFDNQTFVKVDRNSRIIIGDNKLTEYGKASSIKLEIGRVWVRVKEAWKGLTKFEVNTPSAVAGVRGTLFSVAYIDGKTSLLVREGSVELSTGEKKNSKIVEKGEIGEVSKNKITVKKTKKEDSIEWSKAGIDKWINDTAKQAPPGLVNKAKGKEKDNPSLNNNSNNSSNNNPSNNSKNKSNNSSNSSKNKSNNSNNNSNNNSSNSSSNANKNKPSGKGKPN